MGLESYYKISDANITDNLNHLYRLLGWIQTAIEQESFLSLERLYLILFDLRS